MKRKFNNWTNHFFNFLAVILGVYLAFYINERAKLNQDRKESRLLMNSLINDLSDDIKTYEEYQIPKNIQYQENLERLLNLLLSDNLDSLDSQLSSILGVENYAPTTSTYSSMKSSGKLSLFDDLALQKKLSDYYEGQVPESVRKGEFQVEYFTNELLTWLTNNVDLMDMEILKKDELVVLKNKLIIYSSLIDQKVKSYEVIVLDSKKLKLHIESIL
ncbi:hypothetical protein [Aquiflexum lacus]|uniref:hypothetical protein n=1 Tax=Aquiflexum lacus TaxID=2483805 RepID=UPI00189386CD|nr:hypothetical protein [Aquiflexum lacus]